MKKRAKTKANTQSEATALMLDVGHLLVRIAKLTNLSVHRKHQLLSEFVSNVASCFASDQGPGFDFEPIGPGQHAIDLERWGRAVDVVRKVSPRHGKSLAWGRFVGFERGGVMLDFDGGEFHRQVVLGASRVRIESILKVFFGRPFRVRAVTPTLAMLQGGGE